MLVINIDFRFCYTGNGELVKVINQGEKKLGTYLHSTKINFAGGFEGEGVRKLTRILLFSR